MDFQRGQAWGAHRCLLVILLALVQLAGFSGQAHADRVIADNGSGVALGIYQPQFPEDLSALGEYEQQLGQPMPIVHWYAQWGGWKSAFDRTDLDKVSAHGSIPAITWEPWSGDPLGGPDPRWSLRNGILSGRFDDYIDSWARGMADYGKPVLLRFAHEMHDHPFYPWAVGINGNSADDYLAAWRHVRAIFARENATNVEWVWNPHWITGASAATYLAVYTALYPGDDAVDWVGLDVFNTGPDLDWGRPDWESLSGLLSPEYQAATTLSTKPILLPEVGSAESGGSKADWITTALTTDLRQFPRVRGLIWFDVDKEEAWNLDSSPSALSAWLAAVSDPLFAVSANAFLPH